MLPKLIEGHRAQKPTTVDHSVNVADAIASPARVSLSRCHAAVLSLSKGFLWSDPGLCSFSFCFIPIQCFTVWPGLSTFSRRHEISGMWYLHLNISITPTPHHPQNTPSNPSKTQNHSAWWAWDEKHVQPASNWTRSTKPWQPWRRMHAHLDKTTKSSQRAFFRAMGPPTKQLIASTIVSHPSLVRPNCLIIAQTIAKSLPNNGYLWFNSCQ